MRDESIEQEAVTVSVRAAFRVNWFHTERPTGGTTFRRQSGSQPRLLPVEEESTSG